MQRIFLLTGLMTVSIILIACGTANTNQNAANANAKALPPEFQTSPIPITNANNGNVVVNGMPIGSPIPGIDPKNAVQKIKPGGKPTPGIPDPETIRRQMQGLERPNVNTTGNTLQPGGGMMMRKKPLKPVTSPTP